MKLGIVTKKYRSEWKYCLEEADMLTLKQKLKSILDYDSYADENGKYAIHSLYFDDYKDSCARENVAGEGDRFKYRIRYYGTNAEQLWLEKKEKKNSYCRKRKCAISKEECQLILEGKAAEVFWQTKLALLREFCVDIMTRRFVPRVIIDYEREAFVEPITNIRITLDYNISASDDFDFFLTGDYLRTPILEKKKHVLEVKFDSMLPSTIKTILQSNILIQQASSKYYLGRMAIQQRKKFCKVM